MIEYLLLLCLFGPFGIAALVLQAGRIREVGFHRHGLPNVHSDHETAHEAAATFAQEDVDMISAARGCTSSRAEIESAYRQALAHLQSPRPLRFPYAG